MRRQNYISFLFFFRYYTTTFRLPAIAQSLVVGYVLSFSASDKIHAKHSLHGNPENISKELNAHQCFHSNDMSLYK